MVMRLPWLIAAFIASMMATAALARPPLVPAPAGARLLLDVQAQGVQIYTCAKSGDRYRWVFDAPEAALFDAAGRQTGTHAAGPSWQMEDGSKIVGEVLMQAPSPEPHAIPWLLLRVKSHEGSGVLNGVSLVRRVDTHGGTTPTQSCDTGQAQARMRYTARYLFYAAP